MLDKKKVVAMLVETLLEFAPLYNELTTSDLQGVADVKAREFVDLID
jgi:hypothetical protein